MNKTYPALEKRNKRIEDMARLKAIGKALQELTALPVKKICIKCQKGVQYKNKRCKDCQ